MPAGKRPLDWLALYASAVRLFEVCSVKVGLSAGHSGSQRRLRFTLLLSESLICLPLCDFMVER